MKVYQRFSLQHHLDLGKHKCALEHETLRDRAALGYAERLQGQSGSVPQIEQVRKQLNLSNQPFLSMGWALKSSHVKRTLFTETETTYLVNFVLASRPARKQIQHFVLASRPAESRCSLGIQVNDDC